MMSDVVSPESVSFLLFYVTSETEIPEVYVQDPLEQVFSLEDTIERVLCKIWKT